MMATNASKKQRGGNVVHFPYDDAFDDCFDDSITVYGATTERSPLKGCNSNYLNTDESVSATRVLIHDPQQRLKVPLEQIGDNESIIRTDGSDEEFDPSQPCWKHPKIKENWKIVLAATALLVVGLGLFIIGVTITHTSSFSQGVVFLIAGTICFIPGVYHVIYIYLAVKGRRGYYFYHLPLFN